MGKAKILAIVFFLLGAFCGRAESFWKIKTESGEEILLAIDVNATAGTFKASTRKDAIKDIAGFFAYNLAHAAGKLKYPEIIYIEGKASRAKDSLKLNGIFYYTDKKYDFKAVISGDNFQGKYIDNKNRAHRLTGIRQPDSRPVKNYPAILNQVIASSEKYLPDPAWIKSGEWNGFKTAVNELKSKISDDYELGALLMWHARKFPFSPFDVGQVKTEAQKAEKVRPQLQVIKPHVGLLSGSQLPANQKQMDSLASVISKQLVSRLIVDLRGRSTILPVQAKLLLNYFSPKDFSAGAFLTRNWYNLYSSFNVSAEAQKRLKNVSISDDLIKFRDTDGYKLDVVSTTRRFSGEVYVLTDLRTNRIAEVLAYLLQNEKLAKIAGQKTAGQPYITEKFHIQEGFELQIPVAVFIGKDGQNRIKNVTPDIFTEKENALNYLVKIL